MYFAVAMGRVQPPPLASSHTIPVKTFNGSLNRSKGCDGKTYAALHCTSPNTPIIKREGAVAFPSKIISPPKVAFEAMYSTMDNVQDRVYWTSVHGETFIYAKGSIPSNAVSYAVAVTSLGPPLWNLITPSQTESRGYKSNIQVHGDGHVAIGLSLLWLLLSCAWNGYCIVSAGRVRNEPPAEQLELGSGNLERRAIVQMLDAG
ncbi:predicted protein [Histoplasma mississippiense (nom. inval.)]|uniref:predicted protein n=1 Tax=Ajellomyces capsulatus (strain NAm1 / WU24) TaxID=2059318 RepID=UPI000157D468|nr:predicted protein [Histoplasma mississippiense (nom. inval.)]EDN05222.1 predicted protein [Histoplasma mississippiense (nom. inval.)]